MSVLPYAVYALCAGVAGYYNPIAPPGAPGYTSMPKHHFRGIFENDSIAGHDCNYTHGTRLDYAQVMPNGHAWGLSLTQNIYTPKTHTKHRVEGEHPYCGYLAVGAGYLWRSRDFGCSTEFQLGTTGRPSLAGQVQNGLHDMFNMERWDGWGDQIPAELTLQLTSRQDWRVRALERNSADAWQSDSSFYLRESLGTFNVSGGVGGTFRFGQNLPPYAQVTGNSPAVFGVSTLLKPDYDPARISYFMVLEGSLNYVAHDLTVDGGVFRDFRRTCARTPWQPEARAGVCVIWHGVEYNVGVLVRGRTYKTQNENSVTGAFSLSWHW